jgi:cytochrome c-type biogenesis protein CcmH/NrfG
MPDYKSMYYHLAGRTATAVDVLETTIDIMGANAKVMMASAEALMASSKSMMDSVEALANLKEKLKLAQQTTEDMFINSDEDSLVDNSEE